MYEQIEANLNPPDDEIPVKHCDHCDKPLYTGDDYFDIDGDVICENCINDYKCTIEPPGDEYEEDDYPSDEPDDSED